MSHFSDASELEILQIWDGVTGRAVAGAEATLAFIELAPDAVVPEHRHPNEQTGLLLHGSLRFTVVGETSTVGRVTVTSAESRTVVEPATYEATT